MKSYQTGFTILAGVLAMVVLVAISQGAFQIDFYEVLTSIFGQDEAVDEISRNVLFNIRLPRVALAVMAGAVLGLTGAVMQALFRNPLAEPSLVGLSSGASLGAVAAIVLTTGGFFLIALSAFLGGLATTFLTYRLGRTSQAVSGLLLAGIAVNAIVFSLVGLVILNANDAELRDLTFWNMGSLSSANWQILLLLLPVEIVGLVLLLNRWRVLNALLLGEREAHHLGFAIKPVRRQLIILVALMVGPLVAVTGGIGFVGLVMPHLVRMWLGADHRWVLPASALSGALALTTADWLARVLIMPAELPIGLLTSLVGGPFFIWLLLKGQAR